MGCSPIKAVRELGSERSHTALVYSNVNRVAAYIDEALSKNVLIGNIEGRLKIMTKFKNLSAEELAYIAGFLDGGGSINAQIVRRQDYILGFQIRVTVSFFQSTKRHWFILKLENLLGVKTSRKRNDNMSELTLVGVNIVKPFLEKIKPYIQLKKPQVDTVLEICNKLSRNQSPEEFIKLCKKVDLLEDFNDSKKRSIRAVDVENYLAGHNN